MLEFILTECVLWSIAGEMVQESLPGFSMLWAYCIVEVFCPVRSHLVPSWPRLWVQLTVVACFCARALNVTYRVLVKMFLLIFLNYRIVCTVVNVFVDRVSLIYVADS